MAGRKIKKDFYVDVMTVHFSYKMHSYFITATALKVEINRLTAERQRRGGQDDSQASCDRMIRCSRVAEDLSRRYVTFLSSLGRGGNGVVSKVKLPPTDEGQVYALKEVPIREPHTVLHNIIKERDLMTSLRHDNILRLRACWVEYGNAARASTACFLMDFMERGDLEDITRQLHPFLSFKNFKPCHHPMITFEDIHRKMLAAIRTADKSVPNDPKHWDTIYRYDFRLHLARKGKTCITNMAAVYNHYMRIFLVYALELFNGLIYLQEHRIMHRDMKPANVLVDARCHLKIADFGLSSKVNYRHMKESYRYLQSPIFDGREYLLWAFDSVKDHISQTLRRQDRPIRAATKGFYAPENLRGYYQRPEHTAYKAILEQGFKEDIFTGALTLYYVMSGFNPTLIGTAVDQAYRNSFVRDYNQSKNKLDVLKMYMEYGIFQENNSLLQERNAETVIIHRDLAVFVVSLLTANAANRPERPNFRILENLLATYQINKNNPTAVDIHFTKDQFSSEYGTHQSEPSAAQREPFVPSYTSDFAPSGKPVDIPDFEYLSPNLPITVSPRDRQRLRQAR